MARALQTARRAPQQALGSWEGPNLSEPSKPGSVASDLAHGFRLGRSEDVESVRGRVRKIVNFRGYAIPSADRADLVQEILAQLWTATRKPEFDEEGGFLGFVELVSVRRCIDWRRTQRAFVGLSENLRDSRKSALGRVLSAEDEAFAVRALEAIGEPCKKLIEMHFKQQMKYQDIAKQMGRTEGALRMQMFRCIGRVRSIVARLEKGLPLEHERSQR